jgi:acyl carrier protein
MVTRWLGRTSRYTGTISIGGLTLSIEGREKLEQEIIDLFVQVTKLDPSRVTPDATFESLDLVSIDMIEAMMALEEKFGVYIPMDATLSDAKNVEQFVQAIASHIRSARS